MLTPLYGQLSPLTLPTKAAFSPLSLSPLLWLTDTAGLEEADGDAAETGDAISRWLDQSGNGNHLTQGTAGSRPTLTSSGVDFDATDDVLSCALNGTALAELTIATCFSAGSTNLGGVLNWSQVLTSNAPFINLQRQTSTNLRWYVNGGYRFTIAQSIGTVQIHVLTLSAGVWKLYVNSASAVTYSGTNPPALRTNAQNIYMGDGFQARNSSLHKELFIANYALTADQASQLIANMASRNNVSI